MGVKYKNDIEVLKIKTNNNSLNPIIDIATSQNINHWNVYSVKDANTTYKLGDKVIIPTEQGYKEAKITNFSISKNKEIYITCYLTNPEIFEALNFTLLVKKIVRKCEGLGKPKVHPLDKVTTNHSIEVKTMDFGENHPERHYTSKEDLVKIYEEHKPNIGEAFSKYWSDMSSFTTYMKLTENEIFQEYGIKITTNPEQQEKINEIKETEMATKSEKVLKIINDRKETIRIQGILKKRKETLVEFIRRFFNEWNYENDTVFTSTDSLNVNKGVHTEKGRRRSFGDVFLICRYYYPNVTVQEVAKILFFDLFENQPVGIAKMRSSYCNTIKRRVFYTGGSAQSREFLNKETNDEFNFTYEDWEKLIEEPFKAVKVVELKKPVKKKVTKSTY